MALLCRKLGVSRSGYYSWLRRPRCARAIENESLLEEIRAIFKAHRGLYGSPRIHAVLRARGYAYNRKRIERLMRKAKIVSRVTKKFKAKRRDYAHHYGTANLLLEQGVPRKKNRVWVGDVTYIRVNGSWTYLAVVMDLCTRKIIGWAYSRSRDVQNIKDALEMAVNCSPPKSRTIFHSDQGTEYATSNYRNTLLSYGITQSMSRKGHCWDNAWMESFFHSLKTEMIYLQKFSNFVEATAYIMDYITFYNHKRIHSSLNYSTPQEYHRAVA